MILNAELVNIMTVTVGHVVTQTPVTVRISQMMKTGAATMSPKRRLNEDMQQKMKNDPPDYGVPVLIWVDDRWRIAIRVHKEKFMWYCVESDICYENRSVKTWTELPNPPEDCSYQRCYPGDRCDRYDENKCSMYHYWVCEAET